MTPSDVIEECCERFMFASETDRARAMVRAAYVVGIVEAMNARGFLDSEGNVVKYGDRIEFHTLYGTQTGKIIDCQYKVGSIEFPICYEVKITKDPGIWWEFERGPFSHEKPILVTLDGSKLTFDSYNIRKAPDDKIVLQGHAEFKKEDSGMSLIAEIGGKNPHVEGDVFVRIHSYEESENHAQAKRMEGKIVRVTIETLE